MCKPVRNKGQFRHLHWLATSSGLLIGLALWLSWFLCGTAKSVTPDAYRVPITKAPPQTEHVTLINKGTHYEVTLDFTGATHRQVGLEYGQKMAAIPGFERRTDSYLDEVTDHNWSVYKTLVERAARLKTKIPQDYRNEIEGIAAAFSGKPWSFAGDGKLSLDEIYLLSLLPDVGRQTQCSAIAVYGPRSSTQRTIVGRNLDWPDGDRHQVSRSQAIITYRNGKRSIVSIGCLGFEGIMSGFNSNGVFAAILDSPTGAPFNIEGNRSYPLDLRQALEEGSTLDSVCKTMSDSSKRYCFNHLIFLADSKSAGVLENNFSSHGLRTGRAFRSASSRLNKDINWGIANAVAATNAFLLSGNFDNFNHCHEMQNTSSKPRCTVSAHSIQGNASRWDNLKSQLIAAGPVINPQAMERIMSFHTGPLPGPVEAGDIFNADTMQSMVFKPDSGELAIFFRPGQGVLPAHPTFETLKFVL